MNLIRLLAGIPLLAAALAAIPAAAETVIIGGTGSSGPLMQLLADEFRVGHPQVEFRVITPPLGSGGAIRALADGKIDIAVAGRKRNADDPADKFVTMELARTPFVMATRDGVRPRGFSLSELAEVYDGMLTAWDDGQPIRLILRAPTESDTHTLRALSPHMDAAVEAAARRGGMVTAENDLDTVELIGKVPGALAPTTLGLLRTLGAHYRVLPLDGVAPSRQALESGKYRWAKTLFAIHGPQASAATREFFAFLRSAGARELMRRADYQPAPFAP